MTPRKSYSRYFIILQEEQKGYGMDADKAPSGYAKLEVKNNRSRISYYVQNLKKDRGPYYMILITDKQNPRSLINLGRLNIDDNGRADVNFDYDMNSIGNTNIAMDKIVGAAVVYMNGKITPIMIGFSTTDVPKDWTTYPISKGTTQPTTGSGATGTGTGTGTTGAGTTGAGTGTGTTGGMGTGGVGTGTTGTGGTGVGTGTTGGMGTGGIGTGTTGAGGTGTTGTGVGTGAGAGTTGGMGTGGIGTGTTGAGGTGTTGAGTGTAGATGTGTMGTQPSEGTTTNGFIDEFEDYYEDVNIINMAPTTGGSTPTRNMDIFDLYEKEIENSKLDRHKHKKCKHHEEDDCHCKHHEEDDHHCAHHNKHHEDECPEYLMHHMYDDDDYKNDNHCSPCMDNKKHDVKYNNYENNKHEMYKDDMHKYNWPLGNTGEFFKNVVKGFEKLGENENIKNCLWYKVSVDKLEDMYCIYDYNKYTVVFYPMICYYPYISKKKNFIIGYKCDEEGNLKYIIYGIAGTKALEDQPYGGKTGFVTWMPSKNEKDMGHWLMYYDFKTNNVVIPIKR